MKRFFLALLCCFPAFPASSQSFSQPSYVIFDNSGKTAAYALPASFQFPDTAVGDSSSITIKTVNPSSNTVNVIVVAGFVSLSSDDPSINQDFQISGLGFAELKPGTGAPFTLSFSPKTIGDTIGYLRIIYQVRDAVCEPLSCPGTVMVASTLSGHATPAKLTLSYSSGGGAPVLLQPATTNPLNFGNVNVGATFIYTFTLTNYTSSDIATPAISVPFNTNATSPYFLDTSSLPSTIPANSSATFTVKFAPSVANTGVSASLQVGTNSYPLTAAAIPTGGVGDLLITVVDVKGVRTTPQAATPISFGQVVPGTTASLTFTLRNPITSIDSVTIDSLNVSGDGFSLDGQPSQQLVRVPAGGSISFSVSFSPTIAGTFSGTLSIGSLQFQLSGLAPIPPVPTLSLQVTPSVLSSQLQPTLFVPLSFAAPQDAVATLAMQFTPSIYDAPDDPAIMFLGSGSRKLSLKVTSGSDKATYNGQQNIIFQTGTTAGTITFTVTMANTPQYTKSFTIPPAKVQTTSVQAVRHSPNLVLTVSGYDNTLTAGKMSFSFYDTTGKLIGAAIPLDATSQFRDLFFTNNTKGGLFSLQATFPVNGDVTQVGSVSMNWTTNAGQTTSTATFQ